MKQRIINVFCIVFTILFGGIVADFWSLESVHTFIKDELFAVAILFAVLYYVGFREIVWDKTK